VSPLVQQTTSRLSFSCSCSYNAAKLGDDFSKKEDREKGNKLAEDTMKKLIEKLRQCNPGEIRTPIHSSTVSGLEVVSADRTTRRYRYIQRG
jgi:hypothetical protein